MGALPVESVEYIPSIARLRSVPCRSKRIIKDISAQGSAEREPRVRVRRSVRPDYPTTYAEARLSTVPVVACAQELRVFSGARGSYGYASKDGRPGPAWVQRVQRQNHEARSFSVNAHSLAHSDAPVAAPLFNSYMKAFLWAGAVIAMMGVFFSAGLQAALSAGLVG